MVKLSNPTLPKRTELWEAVLETLRNAIITGELEPGTRLVEADLAKMLQVSRWPVRQAITRLEQESLVVRYPNRGAYVVEFSAADIHEIYALRRMLEGYAAREACARMTAEDEQELQRLVDELARLVEAGNMGASATKDVEFHRAVFLIAGSDRLQTMWEILVAPIHALLLIRNTRRGAPASLRLPQSHEELLQSLCSGDPDRAEAQVRQHLELAEQSLLKSLGME